MTAVDLPRRPGRRGRRDGQLSAGPGTYVLLGVIVFVSLFPLYWTFVAAPPSNSCINRVPPSLFPGAYAFANVAKAFHQPRMVPAPVNSFVGTASGTSPGRATRALCGFP